VSERSYKKAWSKERALAFIDDNSGVMFDPKLIAPFKECLKESESD
jgi:putative two-component system response regulator